MAEPNVSGVGQYGRIDHTATSFAGQLRLNAQNPSAAQCF